jgi:hypothetical protein
LKGIYKIPITLEGKCRSESAKTTTIRGPAAKVADFQPTLKIISEEDAHNSTLMETYKRKIPR